jgi:hypothetical protein
MLRIAVELFVREGSYARPETGSNQRALPQILYWNIDRSARPKLLSDSFNAQPQAPATSGVDVAGGRRLRLGVRQ